MSESQIERLGWTDVGVTGVSYCLDVRHGIDNDDFEGRARLAIGVDPTDGQVALSAWADDGDGMVRRLAVWLEPGSERVIGEQLLRLAEVREVEPLTSTPEPSTTETGRQPNIQSSAGGPPERIEEE